MRRLAAIMTSCVLLALPAQALEIETRFSETFQKKLTEDYGQREGKILTESLRRQVERQFERAGVAPEKVVVTIEDARPNRPTFEQLTDKPGLDPIRSVSIGGARVTGVAYDAAGAQIATVDYDWYETDITNVIGHTVWSDANSVFGRFARRFAERLG